ncbi:MAG: hypothetical protein R6U01_09805 [Halorubrum sp.]|uniref:hypothetical protein n=1 Tax=Halorubrum sp. TaxID=1879286 RepID=UPI003970D762
MADLTTRSDDRAQLILVAAVGLAILLTLMTVALNTAVFGEIHVAQTDDSLTEERGVIEYQDSLERGVGGAIAPLNREHDEYETLRSELDDSVATWSALSRSEQLRDGTATTASVERVRYETRIVQNESRAFVDGSGDANWEVAANVSDVRGFEADVAETDLVGGSDCVDDGSCFSVEVEGADGNVWRLSVYDDDGVEIFVQPASGGSETYTASSSAALNVTDGTVDGSDEFTSFLEDGGLAAPYTVRYANADDVSGTYELTVDRRIVDGSIADDDRYGVTGSPRIEAGISAAEVRLRYRSPDLLYETNATIASGESDG